MIKILSIGNSFSQDATAYLHQIAHSCECELLTVNLYIGGCSLKRHWHNLINQSPAYLLEINGTSTGEMIALPEAIQRENWDYITLQQVSYQSVDYNSYQPYLARLISSLKKMKPASEIVLHQTWAYEENSEKLASTGFDSHKAMFHALQQAYARAASASDDCKLIPAGWIFNKLVERGFTNLYRDGFHASIPFGRYVLAATWYEFFTGKPIDEASFCPEELPKKEWLSLQEEIMMHLTSLRQNDANYSLKTASAKKVDNKLLL